MGLGEFLSNVTYLRRLVKALERLADAQEVQAILLQRIADQVAPAVPQVREEDLRSTGPSFSRDREQALLQDWVQDFQERHGRPPRDEEIEAWFDEQDFPPDRPAA